MTTRTLSFGADTDAALTKIATKENVSVDMLRTVYRRGAHTFTASHRPGATRSSWAMARVTAFTRLLRYGRPANSAYTSDNDLLPTTHALSTNSDKAVIASAYATELAAELPDTNTFDQPEDAVLALTEFAGLGYDVEPAVRASWLRAVRNGEDPYRRARMLAELTYDSLDSDLLPLQKGHTS